MSLSKDFQNIIFTKLESCGNDFVLLDARTGASMEGLDLEGVPAIARALCVRRFGVGSDGLILLLSPDQEGTEFSWRFYNPDGSEMGMCGNASRCVAFYVFSRFTQPRVELSFSTTRGVKKSYFTPPDNVGVAFPEPRKNEIDFPDTLKASFVDRGLQYCGFYDSGVPHAVFEAVQSGLPANELLELGREIRNLPVFAPTGTNVSFFEIRDDGIFCTFFEKGVEYLTLSCGTGVLSCCRYLEDAGRGEASDFSIEKKVLMAGGEQFIRRVGSSFLLRSPVREVFSGEMSGF